MHPQPIAPERRHGWTWWRLLGDCAAIGAAFLLAAITAGLLARALEPYLRPLTDAGSPARSVEYDGYVFSIAAIVTTLVCLPLAYWLAGRREPQPGRFLGFKPVSWRAIALACAVMLGVMVGGDMLAQLFEVEQPEFLVDIYASGESPLLLLLSVGIAAPVLEEVLFRGYLFGALQALKVPVWAVVLVTSLAFAALHTQYDPFFMLAIFATGLALAWARVRFDSVVPCIAMHVLNNVLALIAVYLLHQ